MPPLFVLCVFPIDNGHCQVRGRDGAGAGAVALVLHYNFFFQMKMCMIIVATAFPRNNAGMNYALIVMLVRFY